MWFVRFVKLVPLVNQGLNIYTSLNQDTFTTVNLCVQGLHVFEWNMKRNIKNYFTILQCLLLVSLSSVCYLLSFTIQTFILREKWDNKNVVYQKIILNESIQHVQKYLSLFGSPASRRMCAFPRLSLNQALILCSPKHINVIWLALLLNFISHMSFTSLS